VNKYLAEGAECKEYLLELDSISLVKDSLILEKDTQLKSKVRIIKEMSHSMNECHGVNMNMLHTLEKEQAINLKLEDKNKKLRKRFWIVTGVVVVQGFTIYKLITK